MEQEWDIKVLGHIAEEASSSEFIFFLEYVPSVIISSPIDQNILGSTTSIKLSK